MKTMKGLITLGLASALVVGCGKNNEDNNGANNTTANNTTVNNTTVNNTTANNTTANNTTANNTTVNNTTNTNTYTPHDFTCADNVMTPGGAGADLVGTWEVTDGCVGENAFALLGQLCAGGVLTSVVYENYSGHIIVNADNTFQVFSLSDFTAEMFIPEACTTALGGGTCDGLAAFVDGVAPESVVPTCVDEGAVAGNCLCTLTGPAPLFRNGQWADGASAGELVLTYLDQQADDSYDVVTENFQFMTDGTNLMWRDVDTTTSNNGTAAAAEATDCEKYCYGFYATCNDNPNVTPYAGMTECMTACAGFAAGTAGDTMGDTLACRLYHLGVAADSADTANPDTHCPHAQETATAPCQ